MQSKISFAVLSSDEPTRATIAQGLNATGRIRVVADAATPEELESQLSGHPGIGVYVDLGDDPDKGLGWIEAMTEPRPSLLVGGPDESAVILRAMRAGALGYFPAHGLDEELTRIAERLQRAATANAPATAGRVLAVLGAKGGVGGTTVACELAASLARLGQRVALLDAQAYFGDVALHLELSPQYTLADIARADDLDGAFLATVAQHHAASGVYVVAAPIDPEEAEGIEAHHVENAVELLKGEFDFVVVDLPRITDECTLQVLDRTDRVILVTTTDVPSLARTRQHVKLLEQLGHGEEKVQIVANKATRPGLLSDDNPLAALGMTALAWIPDDEPAIRKSVESGKPASLSSSNKVAPVISGLAADVCNGFGIQTAEKEIDESLAGRARSLVEGLKCRLANG
jgi:pilus assembly protein CpaE